MLATHHPIPPNAAAYLGGLNEVYGRFYALWKDNEMIVIQAEPSLSIRRDYDYASDSAALEELDREKDWGLQIIQSLLHTLEFGRSNWAYLIPPKGTSSYRLLQKNHPIHRIQFPTWTRLVQEEDIKVLKWYSCEDRHGLWNGKKVDLFMGWDDSWAKFVDMEMRGQRLMEGRDLDLTFEVLGHVVRNGQVVGLMTEPVHGRMVESCDRALVFGAIAKLQQKGLIYRSICASNIMIADGKVRLLSVSSVIDFAPHATNLFQEQAEYYHWNKLEQLFTELRAHPNFFRPKHTVNSDVEIIPSNPSPGRGLLPDMTFIRFAWSWVFDAYSSSSSSSSSSNSGITTRRRSRTSRHRPVLAPIDICADDHPGVFTIAWGRESRIDTGFLRFQRGRVQFYQPFHPYNRIGNSNRMLVGYEDSDTSSDSGLSSL